MNLDSLLELLVFIAPAPDQGHGPPCLPNGFRPLPAPEAGPPFDPFLNRTRWGLGPFAAEALGHEGIPAPELPVDVGSGATAAIAAQRDVGAELWGPVPPTFQFQDSGLKRRRTRGMAGHAEGEQGLVIVRGAHPDQLTPIGVFFPDP
jgi:hypothetical protein